MSTSTPIKPCGKHSHHSNFFQGECQWCIVEERAALQKDLSKSKEEIHSILETFRAALSDELDPQTGEYVHLLFCSASRKFRIGEQNQCCCCGIGRRIKKLRSERDAALKEVLRKDTAMLEELADLKLDLFGITQMGVSPSAGVIKSRIAILEAALSSPPADDKGT